MAKPQQPELRRSGTVPALDPDATEAVLSAQESPKTSRSRGPVPEEQRPGHRPADEQDKPDMAAFAERLGIPSEGDEPDDAPRVEDDVSAGDVARRDVSRKLSDIRSSNGSTHDETSRDLVTPALKLLLVGPAATYVAARCAYRTAASLIGRRGGQR